jgi:hypothetical protein
VIFSDIYTIFRNAGSLSASAMPHPNDYKSTLHIDSSPENPHTEPSTYPTVPADHTRKRSPATVPQFPAISSSSLLLQRYKKSMRYANNKATIRNYSYSSFTHLLKLDIWTMDYGRFPKILVENGEDGKGETEGKIEEDIYSIYIIEILYNII